ncbi:unnamed protein product [Rangifer tarandus platyrhynchus]|uniref:Uncharacterized protein n=1 Tax=Rangifer tarandus platyrhynchus TaxID=3082113 RepID=A0AC59YQJ7_RANTA
MEEPQTEAAGYGGLSKVSDNASPDSRVDKMEMSEARLLNEAPQTRRDPRPHRRAHPSVPGVQKPTSQDPCPPQRRGSLTAAQLPATAALSAARVPMTHVAPPPRAAGGGSARMRTRIR